MCVIHLVCSYLTLDSIRLPATFDSSIHMEISCRLSVYSFPAFGNTFLSLVNEVTLPENLSHLVQSVYFVPVPVLVSVPSSMAAARYCRSIVGCLQPGQAHVS